MSLQAVLEGYLRAGGALALDYGIGDAFSGRTEVELHGDGAYRAMTTGTPDRQPIEFTGSTDRVRDIVAALADVRVWEAAHVRERPREDDPEAVIAARSDAGDGEVRLWISEIPDVPQFAAAQAALLAFARDVSDGGINAPGR